MEIDGGAEHGHGTNTGLGGRSKKFLKASRRDLLNVAAQRIENTFPTKIVFIVV